MTGQDASAMAHFPKDSVTPPSRPRIVHSIAPVADLIKRIPNTRYYGSKRKLLPWLYSKLKTLDFDSVLDLFGGTASVSQLFRAMHKTVAYHDAFQFNTDVATTLLSADLALTKEQLANCLTEVQPVEGVIARNFRGIFFLDEENCWIDGFISLAQADSGEGPAASLLRYLLYQACLKKRPFNLFHRANLSLRTRPNIDRSFGNISTWERPFSYHIMRAYEELTASRITDAPPSTILPSQDASSVKSGFDLVYLDPPYMSVENRYARDNYWRRYHFLEGIHSYHGWEDKMNQESDIRLMQTPAHFARWSMRETFRETLFELVRKHKSSIVVMSYIRAAVPDETEIVRFFEGVFGEVSAHSVDHSHALSKSRKRELLIVGLPR